MLDYTINSKQWWSFLFAMVKRDISTKYKFTRLGIYWVILNPILKMLIIGFVFQYFVTIKIDNYFIFLYIGLLLWNYFSDTITKNTSIIVEERSLVQKSNFPREIIVLSTIFTNIISLLVSLLLLIILMLLLGIGIYKTWIFLPLTVIILMIVTSGLSLLLSALYVRHRDTGFIVSAILPFWFYSTPIIYSLDILPKAITWILYLNPITFIIELFRYLILGIPVFSLLGCTIGIISTTILSLIGYWYFNIEKFGFSDWI